MISIDRGLPCSGSIDETQSMSKLCTSDALELSTARSTE